MSEIESVKPILTVVDDEGDLVLSSTGPRGKAMAQAVLALAKDTQKVVIISDGEMKVLKKSVSNGANPAEKIVKPAAKRVPVDLSVDPGDDVQEQFVADLESGVTGESAMGEKPSPTPGPSDPVQVPTAKPVKRKPVIFQDAAAPPAPELAEAEMDRLLEEAQQAEKEAAALREQQRFQAQQAVQTGDQTAPAEVETEVAVQPRRRTRERALATTGRPCGRCGGGGQIVGDSGFAGACPVCHGEGTVKTWDRSLKVR